MTLFDLFNGAHLDAARARLVPINDLVRKAGFPQIDVTQDRLDRATRSLWVVAVHAVADELNLPASWVGAHETALALAEDDNPFAGELLAMARDRYGIALEFGPMFEVHIVH